MEPELWIPPPLDECDEVTVPIEPDLTNRLTMRIVRWNGQLVDYAIIHSTLAMSGEWAEIACIDCCHSSVHRHSGRNNDKTPEIIREIHSQQDVQDSFHDSYDEVYDGYLEFKERWGND